MQLTINGQAIEGCEGEVKTSAGVAHAPLAPQPYLSFTINDGEAVERAMHALKDVEYYMALPYTVLLAQEDANTWFAAVAELPGCMTEADSEAEAREMIIDAMRAWLQVRLELGLPIGEPAPRPKGEG